ncbi:DUF6086 family protein [Longispora sp. K20-0274]|uniref:DUF6086 family protein n=1 Tax=Longispora sp. K20-0274 TaxID=3088255 RepID=UPI00399A328C
MSFYFSVGDTTVWNPALSVGKLYVELAQLLAGRADVDSGLRVAQSDDCDVNPVVFREFIATLVSAPGTQHRVYVELVRGFVATSLVMLTRAGIALDEGVRPDWLRDDDLLVARSMAE